VTDQPVLADEMPARTDWEQLADDLSWAARADDAALRLFVRDLLVQCAREDARWEDSTSDVETPVVRQLLRKAVES
jgi:hypothetical protein